MKTLSFTDCFIDRTSGNKKFKTAEYLPSGRLPIIDQGKKFIAGYTNEVESKYNGNLPCIIYGDHSREVKYVDFDFGIGADGVKVLEVKGGLTIKFAFYFLLTVSLPNIGYDRSFKYLKRISIPVPEDYETQYQIVAALDKVTELINKREACVELLNTMMRNIFLHKFQNYLSTETNEFQALGEIASIVSGITKGRKTKDSELFETPYLRVANVQDGYFDLSEIKTINATLKEIEKYQIQSGDLLLTEGGDPDKLGRGNLWTQEETNFIYQNHLFRVRVKDHKKYLPSFLNALVGSDFGKAYFLKNAKQTTGIATINSRQLKAFPVPEVSMAKQLSFEREIKQLKKLQNKLEEVSLPEINHLFQSLLQRAFHGDLTVDSDLQLNGYLESENYNSIATDTVLVQTLIDRFNQVKTDTLLEDDNAIQPRFESETSYNKAQNALFHLLKEEIVFQEIVDKTKEEPLKTHLVTS